MKHDGHQTAGSPLTKQQDGLHFSAYEACRLCPRACGVNRYEQLGFCRAGAMLRAARAALHLWEEPCISGKTGSGAVFFSNCTLRCVFCQNYNISAEGFGRELSVRQLADVFLRLEAQGAANINLVTATHYLPEVVAALDLVRPRLQIPIVYNCGGYERVETLRALEGYVDVYLPDLKYADGALAARCSGAPDYADIAFLAVREMIRQCGVPGISVAEIEATAIKATEQPHAANASATKSTCTYARCGLLQRGVIIRHMVLPGQRKDSIRLLQRMREELPQGRYLLSLMSQYTPFYRAKALAGLNRRVTSYEYDTVLKEALRLGFDGYLQEKSSAAEEYTPPFDLEGLRDLP